MKLLNVVLAAVLSMVAAILPPGVSIYRNRLARRILGRHRTLDVSFGYRMGAGFPGDINRAISHKAEPVLLDPDDPPLSYGIPVMVDSATNGVRQLVAGDADTDPVVVYGFLARPYPQQPATASGYGAVGFGGGVPPTQIPGDALRSGYMVVKLNAGGPVVKGGQVYAWATASAGDHVQGGIEGAASGADTLPIANCTFNGPADADGNVEIAFNV